MYWMTQRFMEVEMFPFYYQETGGYGGWGQPLGKFLRGERRGAEIREKWTIGQRV